MQWKPRYTKRLTTNSNVISIIYPVCSKALHPKHLTRPWYDTKAAVSCGK